MTRDHKNVNIFLLSVVETADSNDNRVTVNRRGNMPTSAYLAVDVTAASPLPHEVNKFLFAYVVLFKRSNFLAILLA